MDKDFVAATIQAIGRCATNIGEVRDTCLNGLVQLLSNRDGESFCVLVVEAQDQYLEVFFCLIMKLPAEKDPIFELNVFIKVL